MEQKKKALGRGLEQLFDSEVLLHLPGGDLKFNVYEKEEELGAFMEGPAQLVFDGEIQ